MDPIHSSFPREKKATSGSGDEKQSSIEMEGSGNLMIYLPDSYLHRRQHRDKRTTRVDGLDTANGESEIRVFEVP